jgi:hypothetical protein
VCLPRKPAGSHTHVSVLACSHCARVANGPTSKRSGGCPTCAPSVNSSTTRKYFVIFLLRTSRAPHSPPFSHSRWVSRCLLDSTRLIACARTWSSSRHTPSDLGRFEPIANRLPDRQSFPIARVCHTRQTSNLPDVNHSLTIPGQAADLGSRPSDTQRAPALPTHPLGLSPLRPGLASDSIRWSYLKRRHAGKGGRGNVSAAATAERRALSLARHGMLGS